MEKYMKTIGIIGGFGPEATAQFYLRLIDQGRKTLHGRQPHILVRNVSVPRELEHDALVLGKNLDQFIPLLNAAAKNLEQAGADLIVLPCNTLHVHEDIIRKTVSVPFVSIIASTVQFLESENISRVGFLGSRVTVQENLFEKKTKNIVFITVNRALQKKIDNGLDIFVGTQSDRQLKEALAKSLTFFVRHGVRDVLFACTDFHGLCPNKNIIRVHDTLDILVHATIDML